MKKAIVILCAFFALASCTTEAILELESPQDLLRNCNDEEIRVSVTVNRADMNPDTKAYIKSVWADGDVVFIFINSISAPKYMELKYNAGAKTWTATGRNGLTENEVKNASDKKFTAVYLPYGSHANVAGSGNTFRFVDNAGNDLNYTGWFLKDENVSYTFDTEMRANFNLASPEFGGYKHVHFDISGFKSKNAHTFKQANIRPFCISGISSGAVSTSIGDKGALIPGYEDGSYMSFSGLLDPTAVGKSLTYSFIVDDTTDDVIYARNVSNLTISESRYFGIGDVSGSVWVRTEYVEMGDGLKWAKCNIGATTPQGAGNFYAWGGKSTRNNFGWSNYEYIRSSGDNNGYAITKYSFKDSQYRGLWYGSFNNFIGAGDGVEHKDLASYGYEDDIARMTQLAEWRIPTKAEWAVLCNTSNFDWKWSSSGATVTSKIRGYEGNSIFLPAAGYRTGGNTQDNYGTSRKGYYWSSTLGNNSMKGSQIIIRKSNANNTVARAEENSSSETANRCIGCSLRSVM